MFIIGAHLSTHNGYAKMAQQAHMIGANTFQFFIRNPHGAKAKTLNTDDVNEMAQIMKQYEMPIIQAYASYVMNFASKSLQTQKYSQQLLNEDLKRLTHFPNNLYAFHPGNHGGQGIDKAINLIADALNKTLTDDLKTQVLLVTMPGEATQVGSTFEQLQKIIEKVELNDKLGVCFDTSSVYAAGYDIVNNLDGVLNEFDDIIGLDRIKSVHLNDSKNKLNSHVNRHTPIGEGEIGLGGIINIINNKKLHNLPFYLETPNRSLDGYKDEIKILHENYKN